MNLRTFVYSIALLFVSSFAVGTSAQGQSFQSLGQQIGQNFSQQGQQIGQNFAQQGQLIGQGFKQQGQQIGQKFQQYGQQVGNNFAQQGQLIGQMGTSLGHQFATGQSVVNHAQPFVQHGPRYGRTTRRQNRVTSQYPVYQQGTTFTVPSQGFVNGTPVNNQRSVYTHGTPVMGHGLRKRREGAAGA